MAQNSQSYHNHFRRRGPKANQPTAAKPADKGFEVNGVTADPTRTYPNTFPDDSGTRTQYDRIVAYSSN